MVGNRRAAFVILSIQLQLDFARWSRIFTLNTRTDSRTARRSGSTAPLTSPLSFSNDAAPVGRLEFCILSRIAPKPSGAYRLGIPLNIPLSFATISFLEEAEY